MIFRVIVEGKEGSEGSEGNSPGSQEEAAVQFETARFGSGQRFAHQTDVQCHRQSRAGGRVVPQRLPGCQRQRQVHQSRGFDGHRQFGDPQPPPHRYGRVHVHGPQLQRTGQHFG